VKKIIFAALLFGFSTQANAGWLGSAVMNGMSDANETVKPTAVYMLGVTGVDVRVYEWQPKGDKNTRCVFITGSTNSSGVACYKINKQK